MATRTQGNAPSTNSHWSPKRRERRGSRPRLLVALLTTVAVLGVSFAASPAGASDRSYLTAPASAASATSDTYSVSTITVGQEEVSGFGGGTIYYPDDVSDGTFGAIAIAPGFTNTQSSVEWFGEYLAAQGFVVMTIDTLSPLDFPGTRGDELLAALDYIVDDSAVAVRERIDPTRLAVAGHSMGGGGAFKAAEDRPSLKAAIGMAPWSIEKSFSETQVPTLVIGAQDDTVAPVDDHAIPLYDGLPSATSKAYLELADEGHSVPTSSNDTIATCVTAWLDRYLNDDASATQVLVPGPVDDPAVSDWQSANVS